MKKAAKAQTKGKTSTHISMGAAIIEALDEAIAYTSGKRTGATVRTVTARRAKATRHFSPPQTPSPNRLY